MSLMKSFFNFIDPPKRPVRKLNRPTKRVSPEGDVLPIGPPLEGIEHIQFGHFSDNNRTPEEQGRFGEAETLFQHKQYPASLLRLFHYLRYEDEDAVHWKILSGTDTPGPFSFELHQGSRLISGTFDGQYLHASVPLARAADPAGTAVMRRLLELNYELRYTSAGMDKDGTFYLVFDTDVATASPQKVFDGLEEMAVKADRQDDSLRTDFPDLLPTPSAPIEEIPETELRVKYRYFREWIKDALRRAATFDEDAYAGAIAHIYLTTVYRLDFLLSPDGPLMMEMERISGLYWKQKDDKALVLRNGMLRSALKNLLTWEEEKVRACLHRTRSTFSLTDNPRMDKVRDNINLALRDAALYQGRRQPELALYLTEYGPLYSLYLYTLPNVVRDLILVQSAVLHPDFFRALGLKQTYYDPKTNTLYDSRIRSAIRSILAPWHNTFLNLNIDFSKIDFTNRYTFCNTYAAQIGQVQI